MSSTPQTRAAYMRGYIKERRRWRRARLIEMLGGECVRCGSTDELEFDHVDPETKLFAVGSDMSRAWATLVAEALKCQLLCRPCHIEKGREDRPEPAHGYYRYWYWGCRCAECRADNAVKSKRQRDRAAVARAELASTSNEPAVTSAKCRSLCTCLDRLAEEVVADASQLF